MYDEESAALFHQWELEQQQSGANGMKINEMIPSKFLKKEDVGRGTLATIRSIEKVNVAVDGAEPEYKYAMSFDELDKPMVLNPTNIHLTAQVCNSEETEEWIGKSIVLYTDPTVTFGGKITGGIRVRAPKPGTKLPEKVTVPDFDDDIPF